MGAAYLTTTLTISPHDPQVINKIGEKVASEHGLQWIHRIWRKNDGFRRSVEESRSLDFTDRLLRMYLFDQEQVNGCGRNQELPSGKLSPKALERNVLRYVGAEEGTFVGPAVGEDAAVIECREVNIWSFHPIR